MSYSLDSRKLVLIDGKFVHRAAKFLDVQIDYSLLRDWLQERGFNMIWYYNSVVYREGEDEQSVIKLFDFLATNGFMVSIEEINEGEHQYGFDVIMAAKGVQFMRDYTDIMFMTSGSALLPVVELIHQASPARVHLASLWTNQQGTPSSSMAMKRAVWEAHDIKQIFECIKSQK